MAFEALKELCLEAPRRKWLHDAPDGPILIVQGSFSNELLTRLEAEGLFRTRISEAPGETRFKVPRERGSFVAKDLEDFLSEGCRDLRVPDSHFIVEQSEVQQVEDFAFLEECLDFKKHLDALSSHSEAGAWIFLQIKKLIVRRELSLPDFRAAQSQQVSLKKAIAFLSDTSAEHARSEIFRGALISEFKVGRGGPATTFGDVVSRIDAVFERVETDFALYVHEHGFEKLKDEALARKVDTAVKIDKVVSTMEAIGLTIPPAVYGAAKEVERGGGIDLFQLPPDSNSILTYASLLFALLMFFAFLRQLMLIKDLRSDCKAAEEGFKERAGESDEHRRRIEELYKPLKSRLSWSCWFSWIRMVLAFLPLVVTVLLALTDSQREAIFNFGR